MQGRFDEALAIEEDVYAVAAESLGINHPETRGHKECWDDLKYRKIPVTILSRCQRFDFGGIGTSKIAERLREVVQAEGLHADDEALEMVARRAGGSMRDAQSLLDQLLAFGGERLTGEQVHRLLGTAGDDRVAELAAAVLGHEAAQALEFLARTAADGLQLGELVDQLIEYWRDLMVLKCAGSRGERPERIEPAAERPSPAKREGLSLDTILAGLDILAATKARLRGSNHARTLVEMALVRLGRLDDLVSLAQLADWMKGGAMPADTWPSAGRSDAGFAAARVAASEAASGSRLPRASRGPDGGIVAAGLGGSCLPNCRRCTAATRKKRGIPAIFAPNTLVLRFAPDYNAQCKDCQEPRRVEKVEGLLRSLTGQGVEPSGRIGCGGRRPPAKLTTAEEPDGNQSRSRRQRDEALREPLVKRAIEVLGAQIVRVDDGFGTAPAASGERAERD